MALDSCCAGIYSEVMSLQRTKFCGTKSVQRACKFVVSGYISEMKLDFEGFCIGKPSAVLSTHQTVTDMLKSELQSSI